jgi:hypothetical protein
MLVQINATMTPRAYSDQVNRQTLTQFDVGSNVDNRIEPAP